MHVHGMKFELENKCIYFSSIWISFLCVLWWKYGSKFTFSSSNSNNLNTQGLFFLFKTTIEFFSSKQHFSYIILRVSLITFSRPRHSRTVPPTDDLRADMEVTMIHLFILLSYLSIEFKEAEPSLPPKEYKKLSISTTSWVDLKIKKGRKLD